MLHSFTLPLLNCLAKTIHSFERWMNAFTEYFEYWTCAIWAKKKRRNNGLVSYTWGNMNNNMRLNLKSVLNITVEGEYQTQTKNYRTISILSQFHRIILCWNYWKLANRELNRNKIQFEWIWNGIDVKE